MSLAEQTCEPCRGGIPPLSAEVILALAPQIPTWEVNQRLVKTYQFPDFAQGLAFVNQVGALAEAQGHHPDIYLAWGKVRLEIWTHAIGGLTQSDFILAAKIDRL